MNQVRTNEPGDAELVADVLNGRTERYGLLVGRHQERLFRHARGMGLDPDTAEDMIQEALVRAYTSLEECRDPSRFGLWVGRILRNRCLDHLKSARSRRRAPLRPDLPADRGDPEREHERGAVHDALVSSLESLPAEQREAFTLKHVEGRSYEEMAELAEASVSAMKMRVHRAREALRTALEGGVDPAGVGEGV